MWFRMERGWRATYFLCPRIHTSIEISRQRPINVSRIICDPVCFILRSARRRETKKLNNMEPFFLAFPFSFFFFPFFRECPLSRYAHTHHGRNGMRVINEIAESRVPHRRERRRTETRCATKPVPRIRNNTAARSAPG